MFKSNDMYVQIFTSAAALVENDRCQTFLIKDGHIKQVPLAYALMSQRRAVDYEMCTMYRYVLIIIQNLYYLSYRYSLNRFFLTRVILTYRFILTICGTISL